MTMAMDASERQFVTLAGGLVLPVEPCVLALDLEARGFHMTREAGDVLSVQPYQRLTREDCAALRRWKWHVLALLDYTPPAVQH
jgi:hypothetical protein